MLHWKMLGRSLAKMLVDADRARQKLARTIIILASVGETNPDKLKWFALHVARGALQAEQAAKRTRQNCIRAA